MSGEYRVALIGFSDFERGALKTFFRLASGRVPRYVETGSLADAQFVIADADLPDAVQAVLLADRVALTVFVGADAPAEATLRVRRPVDPLAIQRELDAAVALHDPDALTTPQPLAPAASDRDAARRRAAERAPLAAAGRAPVLVVDDSDIALRFLARLVERLGLVPALATNSDEALQAMAATRFRAVLLDIGLGDDSPLDGFALCQRIKAEQRDADGHAPFVALVTGRGQQADRVRATLAGADAYLTKPIDEAGLRAALATALAPPPSGRRRAVQRRQ